MQDKGSYLASRLSPEGSTADRTGIRLQTVPKVLQSEKGEATLERRGLRVARVEGADCSESLRFSRSLKNGLALTLKLDHIQRLNLHVLLGAQRGDVATIRALWALQDKLALTPEEEKAIELKRELVAGQERVVWNPALAIPPKQLDFTDTELARVRSAVETWASYGVTADRRWLEPLLACLSTQPNRVPNRQISRRVELTMR